MARTKRNQKVVFEHTIKVKEWQIKAMVEVLNSRCIDPDEEPLVTLEEILDSPKLLKYLCVEWLEGDLTENSMQEHVDFDGWFEWQKYRKKKYSNKEVK